MSGEESDRDDLYGTRYEAFYRLISVQEADVNRWTAWCRSPRCVSRGGNWSATESYSYEAAREKGLAHCAEKHESGGGAPSSALRGEA